MRITVTSRRAKTDIRNVGICEESGKWLVVQVREAWNNGQGVGGGDVLFGVIRAQVCSDAARVDGFIGFLKVDRERVESGPARLDVAIEKIAVEPQSLKVVVTGLRA